jgi:hypothetical protein
VRRGPALVRRRRGGAGRCWPRRGGAGRRWPRAALVRRRRGGAGRRWPRRGGAGRRRPRSVEGAVSAVDGAEELQMGESWFWGGGVRVGGLRPLRVWGRARDAGGWTSGESGPAESGTSNRASQPGRAQRLFSVEVGTAQMRGTG